MHKNTYTNVLIIALFVVAKCWKRFECPPVGKWLHKLWYIHILNINRLTKKIKICHVIAKSPRHIINI